MSNSSFATLTPQMIAKQVMKESVVPSAQRIRLEMQRKGWSSVDKLDDKQGWGIDDNGNPIWGYTIWFYRWDWHELVGQKAMFHAGTTDLSKIDEITRKAADLACLAWEKCPDTPVVQIGDGELRPVIQLVESS